MDFVPHHLLYIGSALGGDGLLLARYFPINTSTMRAAHLLLMGMMDLCQEVWVVHSHHLILIPN